MSGKSPRAFPFRLAYRMTPVDRREDVLGDLVEGHANRVRGGSRLGASVWLWREIAALAWWQLRQPRPSTGGVGGQGPTDVRQFFWLADLWRDCRLGVRTLRRQPRFSALALVIFGLGIGAPATLFTLASRAFLATPGKVAHPEQLIRLFWSWGPGTGGSLSYPDYQYFRSENTTLSGLMAYDDFGVVAAYQIGPMIDQLRAQPVSDNFFDVLGVGPHLGRFLSPDEGRTPGQGAVVILSHGFWHRVFAGNPDAVGSVILLNGHPFEVVGVAPDGFTAFGSLEEVPDAWVPIMMYDILQPQPDASWVRHVSGSRSNWLNVVGRVARGTDALAAEAELTSLGAAYRHRPESDGLLVSSRYQYTPRQALGLSRLFRMLLVVGGIVLIIAAANVAGLLLIRTADRSREVGIRTAIGASSGRIVRQLIAENLMLGLGGCVIGLAIAFGTADLASTLLPYRFIGDFRPDGLVLVSTATIALATAVVVGVGPAFRAARVDATTVIREGPPSIVRSRLWRALVVSQVALSLVLVSGAVLFAKSFTAARNQSLGFNTNGRSLVQVQLRNHGYDETSGSGFIAAAVERLGAIPGAEAVSTTRMVPFRGMWTNSVRVPADFAGPSRDGYVETGINAVSVGYFAAMDIPMLSGRDFSSADTPGTEPVAIINRTLAEALWPGNAAVGQHLGLEGGHNPRIIGVVENAVYYRLGEEPRFQVYAPTTQRFAARVHFLVVSTMPPAELLPLMQAALHDLNPTLAYPWSGTIESVVQGQASRFATSAIMVGGLSLLALILAATGLYAIVSFFVTQRTHEIGIRMALGAVPGVVASGVLKVGVGLAIVGVALGIAGSWGLSGMTRSLLFGVEPGDPWVFTIAAAVLVLVTVLASLVPALRATKVNPVEAIRAE